jgi:hypothetical protein
MGARLRTAILSAGNLCIFEWHNQECTGSRKYAREGEGGGGYRPQRSLWPLWSTGVQYRKLPQEVPRMPMVDMDQWQETAYDPVYRGCQIS